MVTLSIKLRRTHQCRTITGLYCSLFPVDKCSSCPEGWIQHRGKCYHFTNERSSWQKSKKYCSSHGSRLLRIENKEELVGNLPFALFSYIFQTTPAQYLSGGEVGYGYKMKNNTGRVNDFLNCLCSIQNCVPKGDWADLGHQRRSECKFYHWLQEWLKRVWCPSLGISALHNMRKGQSPFLGSESPLPPSWITTSSIEVNEMKPIWK